METCGQCPGAMSPDLLLGRSRKYCDEGKVMYFGLGACVWRGAALARGTGALPGMHSGSPGICSGQGPVSSGLLLLSGSVSCKYSLRDLGFVRVERLKYPKFRHAKLCAADFKTPKRICRLAVFVWFLFSCSFCTYKRGFVLCGP